MSSSEARRKADPLGRPESVTSGQFSRSKGGPNEQVQTGRGGEASQGGGGSRVRRTQLGGEELNLDSETSLTLEVASVCQCKGIRSSPWLEDSTCHKAFAPVPQLLAGQRCATAGPQSPCSLDSHTAKA